MSNVSFLDNKFLRMQESYGWSYISVIYFKKAQLQIFLVIPLVLDCVGESIKSKHYQIR